MTVAVHDQADRHRYEVTADEELAGFAVYSQRPGLIAFTHTEIHSRFDGQGLGSRLVHDALEDARGRGLAVLPFCPFVNRYIAGHSEYVDLVPKEQRERFGL